MNRKILYHFFENRATLDEEKQIRSWMNKSEVNFQRFMQARKEYDIFTLSNSDTTRKNRKIVHSQKLFGIAAAVILVLIVGGLYLFRFVNKSEQYNTILVPPGQRINLILSDNSNVWLNANTTFRYPTQFSKKNRTIFLDGEAYLDVSKNKRKPFIIKTKQGDIRVTGTSLNVEAYSKYDSFETSLFTGSVDIYRNEAKVVSLKPNEKSTLDNDELIISNIIDTDEYLWRKGLIVFNNKKLEDILLSLEKYFDVSIQINSKSLPQHTYTGKFRQSDGVDYALRVLQRSIQFQYERDEITGTIYIK
ncbi:FecR family protein [Proteiniphilum sp. UBA5510]|uniref:FecR family protein n=1 Tax=Proteiniphilum sp. UBA5510 TaxID=1947286 RepID=UPI00257BD124|nr:FecR family protein [Proteiniphilum sp. UBA5510]